MMKSKISCFDAGIARNLARRFWPIWAVYFAAMVVAFPLELTSVTIYSYAQANARVLECAMKSARVAIPAGAAMAMAMFSYMYSSRSVGMICSLPLRRETMYMTALLCGLVPMLIADVIAVLLGAVVVSGWAYVETYVLAEALGIIAMETVAFYGFAVFCGQLTGNILVLPLVYLLLNVSVYAVELGLRYLLSNFVYGMAGSSCELIALSPIIYATNFFNVFWTDVGTAEITVAGSGAVSTPQTAGWTVRGLPQLGAYCAAGLLLMAAGLFMYRRRRMECASDAVAIPVLRPIFKYCMCFGGAIVVAYLVYANFGLNRRFVGLPEAFVLMLLMSAGAAVGYFMAKMIMEKTLHVFSTGWRGLGICVGIIAVFIFTWEFDLYGYERYVPAQEDVGSVTLSVDYMTPDAFTEQQNITDVRELHRRIINEKRSYEKRNYERYDGVWLTLNYELKDGSTTQRSYYLLNTAAEAEDKNSEIWLVQNIVNSSEAIKARTATPQAVTPETVYQAYIGFYNPEIASYGSTVDLTPEQASELYDSCIQPEIDEGRLGKVWLIPELDRQYLVSVNIGLLIPEEQLTDDVGYWPVQWINLDLSADSPLTNAWIREHFPNVIWATYAETDFGYY